MKNIKKGDVVKIVYTKDKQNKFITRDMWYIAIVENLIFKNRNKYISDGLPDIIGKVIKEKDKKHAIIYSGTGNFYLYDYIIKLTDKEIDELMVDMI